MIKVSMTSHIGRAQHDNRCGKDTRITNAGGLAKTERHNNHDYTADDVLKMESDINLALKSFNKQYDRHLNAVAHLDLVDSVKKIYHEEFDAAVAEYNKQQIAKGEARRCIDDYFQKISDDKKQELAVEGIIQFGDMNDWADMSIKDRKKAEPILLKGLQEIMQIEGFRLAGASLHLNESSPHLHYVCVCVDDKERKTGLKKRISKAKVFSKDILSEVLQDRVREVMEPDIKEIFGWEFKEKRTGRNNDLSKNQLMNWQLQEEIEFKSQQCEVLKQQLHSLEETNKDLKLANQQLDQECDMLFETSVLLEQECDKLKKESHTLLEEKKKMKQEQEKLENDLKTLKNERNRLVEAIKELVDAIKPLERLKGVLETIREFGDVFIDAVVTIHSRFNISENEHEKLMHLARIADNQDTKLEDAIELAEKIADEYDFER